MAGAVAVEFSWPKREFFLVAVFGLPGFKKKRRVFF
jgi:hypothetical protein